MSQLLPQSGGLPDDPVADVHDLIGEVPIRAMVAAFYRRVPADPILGPMYPAHDLAGAEARLADFLVQRFGGSDDYSRRRGHPRLRMRHAPFAIDEAAADRWIELMTAAIEEVALDSRVRARVVEFLSGVATFLRNRE
ncbi:MAG: globin [Planctomycetota bacterium]